MFKILVVDDEPLFGPPFKRALEGAGYQVRVAQSGAEALEAIEAESFDLLLEDLRLPDADGMEIMREVLQRMPRCRALVMTGHGTIEIAVEAMKKGAFDFLLKPFPMEDLFAKICRVVELQGLQYDLDTLSVQKACGMQIVTRNPVMQEVLHKALIVAATNISVLMQGESGCGKELIADIIHGQSNRRDQPCIKVNCAAIPETLFESELFGVERGAYTGASKSRNGYLEEADGGTLFLDEISELPLSLQGKLLRTLDDKTFYRVGANRMSHADFRLIGATNKHLPTLVNDGQFREDLYFRIQVMPITIPPLRERPEDLPPLIAHFQTLFPQGNPDRKPRFSPEALDLLTSYTYPGNVRELKNIIEHLAIIYPKETIKPRHLTALLQHADIVGKLFESFAVGKPLKEAVAEFESKYIEKVLLSVGGHKTRSADILGLSRKVLWERLKRLGLSDPHS